MINNRGYIYDNIYDAIKGIRKVICDVIETEKAKNEMKYVGKIKYVAFENEDLGEKIKETPIVYCTFDTAQNTNSTSQTDNWTMLIHFNVISSNGKLHERSEESNNVCSDIYKMMKRGKFTTDCIVNSKVISFDNFVTDIGKTGSSISCSELVVEIEFRTR